MIMHALSDNAVVEGFADIGYGLDLLYMADGTLRVAHDCKLIGDNERERVLLPLSARSIFTPAPVTITPSIHCDECGLHGWVIRGHWSPA